MRLLLGILERERPESAIIFCNTKRYTEIVAKRLRLNGKTCEFIIGDLPQSRRLKVIDDVKAGKIKMLVATDVAARGLDIEGLAMVVNYDLPVEAENYVHRIGRTARAGKTGRAITLASEQDVYELPAIERYIGKKIPSEIALPELYYDDLSAGQQIQTDFYEDRGETRGGASRSGPRSGTRSDSRSGARSPRRGESRSDGRGEGRGGEGRDTGRKPRPRGQDKRDKRDGSKEKPRQGRGQGRRQDAPPLAGQDLSQMSFDERMALYKKKYDTAKPESEQKAHGHGRKAPAKSGGRKSEPAKETSSSQEQPEQTAPAKKGFFSRLLGKFRKK
jgi:ATP-dependent RNA helicase RhlB